MASIAGRISAILVGLILGAVALSVLITMVITRSITGPVIEGMRVAERLADGDLTVAVASIGKDETGMMLASMRHDAREAQGRWSATSSRPRTTWRRGRRSSPRARRR